MQPIYMHTCMVYVLSVQWKKKYTDVRRARLEGLMHSSERDIQKLKDEIVSIESQIESLTSSSLPEKQGE